jgi:hypothetical protein
VIAEFEVSRNPDRSRRGGRRLLTVDQPVANHNGGMIAIGPDGFLYIALGDGGSSGDPGNRAQDPDVLLGKILRIDVDRRRPYAIPEGNPFADGGGRPEIYALGLRNPWRFSFDRRKGRLYVGDVGQGEREEIDIVRRGRNYGWRVLEGSRCFDPPEDCERSGLKLPRAEYSHEGGRCSVTGGYVYRGREVPALKGIYVFADYCSGDIFALRRRERSGHRPRDHLVRRGRGRRTLRGRPRRHDLPDRGGTVGGLQAVLVPGAGQPESFTIGASPAWRGRHGEHASEPIAGIWLRGLPVRQWLVERGVDSRGRCRPQSDPLGWRSRASRTMAAMSRWHLANPASQPCVYCVSVA